MLNYNEFDCQLQMGNEQWSPVLKSDVLLSIQISLKFLLLIEKPTSSVTIS